MAKFLDMHRGMAGITGDQLKRAHSADVEIQDEVE